MINSLALLTILIMLGISCKTNQSQQSETKWIFGKDDRLSYQEFIPSLMEQAKSVGIMKSDNFFGTKASFLGPMVVKLPNRLTDSVKNKNAEHLCPDVRFREEYVNGSCSVFLIHPQIIATSGHCVKELLELNRKGIEPKESQLSFIIFDYYKSGKASYLEFPSENVFKVQKLLSGLNESDSSANKEYDFVFLSLDRPTKCKPFVISWENTMNEQSEMYVLGHPAGIPMKASKSTIKEIE